MSDDRRLVTGRATVDSLRLVVVQRRVLDPSALEIVANDVEALCEFAEERLRVNVGLVHENEDLRRKVQELSHAKESS